MSGGERSHRKDGIRECDGWVDERWQVDETARIRIARL